MLLLGHLGMLIERRTVGVCRLVRYRVLAASVVSVLAVASMAFTETLPIVFGPPVDVSNTPGLSQAAAIALDDAGSVYVAWEERAVEQLLFARSTDSATTFTTPIPVVPGAEWLSFGQVRIASLRASDVRMAFTSFDTLYGGAEIVYAASIDGGDSFSRIDVVSTIDPANSYNPDIAVGWGIAIAWTDSDLETGAGALRWTLSTDEGETFSEPRRLDDGDHQVLCPTLALAGDGTAYAAWMQNESPYGADEA